MKTAAVICEYNPFHLGHAHQLCEMGKNGARVCIMSGNFTQRGSAAVLSKYERARLAVLAGADLVLELPFPFCASGGEFFARGGVAVAEGLSAVDTLCFGSESGDTEAFLTAVKNTESAAFREALAAYLSEKKNASYRTAFGEVYRALYGEDVLFSGSNDILGFLYVQALQRSGSAILPQALRRIGEDYNGDGVGFPSATSIRRMIRTGDEDELKKSVPSAVFDVLIEAMAADHIADHEKFFPIFAAAARAGLLSGADVFDVPAELADRILCAAKAARNMDELLSLAKTKNFSDSRIRRAMLMMFFGVRSTDAEAVRYTTVLAANERGREILSRVRKTATLPILTKPADGKYLPPEARRAFELVARADSVWELLCEHPREGGAMLRERPRMVNTRS